MNTTSFSKYEFGDDLLRFFVENRVISEGKANVIQGTAEVLAESAKVNTDPTKFIINDLGNTIEVRFADFWSVYNDISKYKTNDSILIAVGFVFNSTDPVTGEKFSDHQIKNARKQAKYMAGHFSEYYGKNYYIPTPQFRNEILFKKLNYTKLEDVPTILGINGKLEIDVQTVTNSKVGATDSSDSLSFEDIVPTQDAIDFGKIGKDTSRSGMIIQKINNQDIIEGTLYSNISRIKKQTFFSWLRSWKKDTVGLSPESSGIFGRNWKKIFILGYAVSESLFYEIWFNTIDSTYTLHDSRGAIIGRRSQTMFEAIRTLFQQLARAGLSDGEFLRSGVDKSTMDSFVRAVNGEVDTHMKDMAEREKKDAEKAEKEYAKREEEREKFKDMIKSGIKTVGEFAWEEIKKEVGIRRENPNSTKADKERQEIMQRSDKLLGSDVVYDPETGTYVPKIRRISKEVKPKQIGKVTESFNEEADLQDLLNAQVTAPEYDSEMRQLRTEAKKESPTFKILQQKVMGSIEKYDETKVNPSKFRSIFSFLDSREVELPTDKRGIFNRIKMFLTGTFYRADFVIGYSLGERVDLELWYVTEPNPTYSGGMDKKIISSFYLYDVTSGRLLRKYIPYFRNGEQLILQKFGVGDIMKPTTTPQQGFQRTQQARGRF
jgi:hypothetical protein